MTALWGSVIREHPFRPLRAECKECGWVGESHHQPDSEAVRLAATDSNLHNKTVHAELPEGALF